MEEPKKWTTQKLGEAFAIHCVENDAIITELTAKADLMYKALVLGNGHEPLVRTIARNTEWIGTVKRFLWLIVGAVITSIIAGFGAILTALASLIYMIIKIAPLLQAIDKSGITRIIAR